MEINLRHSKRPVDRPGLATTLLLDDRLLWIRLQYDFTLNNYYKAWNIPEVGYVTNVTAICTYLEEQTSDANHHEYKKLKVCPTESHVPFDR